MDNEQLAELQEDAETARLIDEMVNTTAWQKIVIPRFQIMKDEAMKVILESLNINEIFNARETIKAIDEIISFLILKINIGEEAKIQLANIKE